MADTPPAIRGQCYNTHLYARCPNYQQCRRCHMCSQFDPHNAICTACEGSKPGGRHHTCTSDQINAIVMYEERSGRPIRDMNQEGQNVEHKVCETASGENAQMIEALQAQEWTNRKRA